MPLALLSHCFGSSKRVRVSLRGEGGSRPAPDDRELSLRHANDCFPPKQAIRKPPQPLAFPVNFRRSIARRFLAIECTWNLSERPKSERKCVAEESAHLLAIIGCRIFTYEFMRHSKPTRRLTQVRNVGAKNYTGGMSGFHP